MLSTLSTYLFNITSEEESQNLLQCLSSLMDVYQDTTIEVGIGNYISLLDDDTSFNNKIKLYDFIKTKQLDMLRGAGIIPVEINNEDIMLFNNIINLFFDLESYEFKQDIYDICCNAENNIDALVAILVELYAIEDTEMYYELIDIVDDQFIETVKDYLYNPADDISTMPTLTTTRLTLFKTLITENKNIGKVSESYLLQGYSANINLNEILDVMNEDLLNIDANDVKTELYLLYLLSNTNNRDSKAILNEWAKTNIEDNKVIFEIMEMELTVDDE